MLGAALIRTVNATQIDFDAIPQFQDFYQVAVYGVTVGIVVAFVIIMFLVWSGRRRIEIKVEEQRSDNRVQHFFMEQLGMSMEQARDYLQQVSKLTSDVALLSSENGRLQTQVELANEKYARTQDHLAWHKERLVAFEQSDADKESEIEELRKEIAKLRAQLQEVLEERDRLLEAVREKDERISILETQPISQTPTQE